MSNLSTASLKRDFDIIDAYTKYHKQEYTRRARGGPIPEYKVPCARLQLAADIGTTIHNTRGIKKRTFDDTHTIGDFKAKVNEIYELGGNFSEQDRDSLVLTLTLLGKLIHKIDSSEGNRSEANRTGMILVKIRGIDTPIPMKLQVFTNIPDSDSDSDLQNSIGFLLYKEPVFNNRRLDISLDDIEKINIVTMVTLRTLQREVKKMARAIDNIGDTAAPFDASLV